MNILFFSRLFYPHIGGVEKHIFEIGKILIQKGHKVLVVAEKHDSKLKNFEIINKIGVYRIPILNQGWFKKFEIWSWLIKHKNLIRIADIVHCHDVFFWYLPFRFLYLRKSVFTTFHGYEGYPLRPRDILVRRVSGKLSNGNICIGDFIKKWYGTKPNFVSYGGVNEINLSSRSGEKLKIKNENSALFIGRLDEQTGIKTYVSAVKLIRKKMPNFKFEIIGDGKYRKEIEKNFKVLGFQKDPEKYFQNYNFAFVSRYLSILEAMAAKRLVFAVYDNPLKEDYLRMSPFSKYITISSFSSELAAKISFYSTNLKAKKKMIDEAYAWVKNHTWEEVVNTYSKLWKT